MLLFKARSSRRRGRTSARSTKARAGVVTGMHGHIDPRPALLQHAEQNTACDVTERRAGPAAQNSSNEAAMEGERGSAYRVDALVHPMQSMVLHAPPDRVIAQPEVDELGAGDHPVLALGKRHSPPSLPVVRRAHHGAASTLSGRMPAFKELGLSESTLEALAHLGYERPTPIQEQAIPPLLEGRDVIGQAQTGTGKTAAFGLPMVEYVDPTHTAVQALVLTPTRELCIQVTQALRAYGERKGIEVVAVFGGAPIRDQATRLKEAHVAVGTVGRVMDMMSRHHLYLDDARYIVLDEADEMLDLGFLEDVEDIMRRAPMGRQTALFSATVPAEIRRLAEQFMHDPVEIQVRAATLTIDTVAHYYVEVADREKVEALVNLIQAERPEQAIVFARTKIGVDRLARRLGDAGVRVKALHGDMSQGQRDGVMIAFKGGRERLLVATDVAARGLDITGVSHVVNYDIPNSPDVYVHRIGRTGRAGESGRAITLITPKQRRDLEAIERHAKTEIELWEPNGKPEGGRERTPRERTPRQRTPREPRETRRPRHTKPHEREGVAYRKLVVGAGRQDGIEPADIVGAVVDNTHLENDDVRNVRVLERFSFVDVPADRAAQVAESVSGKQVRGVELRLEVAKKR
jgi:ATP-dependent RNA helicase DeaD